MPMQNPPHPGETLQSLCLEPLGLTVTRAAKGLRVSRRTLTNLIKGRGGVSADMALRLSMAFGSTPETWLRLQSSYDLWQARQRAGVIDVEQLQEPSSAS